MPQGHKHLVNPPFAHLYKCISHIYDQSGTVLGVIHTEVLLPSSDWHIVGAQQRIVESHRTYHTLWTPFLPNISPAAGLHSGMEGRPSPLTT